MSFHSNILFHSRIEDDHLIISSRKNTVAGFDHSFGDVKYRFNPVSERIVNITDEIVKYDIGLDGLPYVVLRDNCYSYELNEAIEGNGVGCWNGYENSVCLQNTIGL